jgi:rhamnulose-1-phosphate aldolase/alcohol dehydrogenase
VDYRWDDTVAAKMADDLDRLVYLSSLVGADASLAGAGGGNSSLKRLERDFAGRLVEALWVKARGVDLRDIRREGFTALRLEDLRMLRAREAMSDEALMEFMSACRLDARQGAPTIETPIHGYLPYPVVLHVHDLATQSLTDTSRRDALVREALGEDVAYIGYVRSGFPMARALAGLPDLGTTRGLVLGKRGMVTWGETPKACYDNLHRLITRMEERIVRARATRDPFARVRYAPDARARTAREILPELRGRVSAHRLAILHLDSSPEALRFVNSETCKQVYRRGMASPENIIKCGRLPCYVDADLGALPPAERTEAMKKAVDVFESDYRASFAKHGHGGEMLGPSPRVVLLPGLGVVGAGPDKKAARVAALNYLEVIRVIEASEALDQFRFLDEASAFEFEYWPLAVAGQRKAERDLSRRVALVTGAAAGIGRAVAGRLALEGAHVVLADLDARGVCRAAEEIIAETGDPFRALAVPGDATREEDVAHAFDRAVLEFGGVDVLVCNAGYVKSEAFDQTTLDAWQKTLSTNVTGPFLAVREAARIMKAQGFGSIVVNASKAAFSAPLNNAAYAASKAASAHFTRCLAAELGPWGIRANYVNADFIDTPMMRRMAEDRAAQKGITPEAQVEEYRKRNLLKVGPIPPAAVAEAVLYFASDRSRYTTGSVLTVDGGLTDAMPR